MTAAIKGLNDRLRRLPRTAHLLIGALLLLGVWRLDYSTSAQISFAIFYLIPIGYVAWFRGEPWSYFTALLSAAAWLNADIHDIAQHGGYESWEVLYMGAATRLGFFLLVTALAALVDRLRRLNDVEREASQLKSDMVALVSHEFGNALTTLRLVVTLLKESADGSEAERSEHYAVLERVIAHLSLTTANFLNLNRMSEGRYVPHLRLTRMRSVAREALTLLEPTIEDRNIAVVLDFPPKGVPVRADPDALSVVMTNLLGNAFKYTEDGGTVIVRISVEENSVLVSVEDTGIGIAPEDREKIMSREYRAGAASRVAKGYGVGLKVVRDLLKSQGSSLGVESEVGKGSRFYFRLPLWTEPMNDAPART
ncbi:MAG TPA: HAMP domain-containing sensor histidine kinase [Elusimicrobiota bacterium]|nr:HAMP domain-containing sensor histidine kinase [Elusimicrobiota bacterium]